MQTTIEIINTLIGEYQAEIEHAGCLEGGSTILLQPNWIPGTELAIGVPSTKWQQVWSYIPERSVYSDMIHSYTLNTDEPAIFLRMGKDVWQSTRCDRFRGSRILCMPNDQPADSTSRLQTVKLVRGHGTGVLGYEGNDVQRQHEHWRLLAHFSRMSIGLSPRDSGILIGRIARENTHTIVDSRVLSKVFHPEEKLMITAAFTAIWHAQKEGYWTKRCNMLSPQGLKALDDEYRISAIDRSFDNSWGVLVCLSGNRAREALCQRQPSLFMETPRMLHCKPQVHIIETSIYGQHFPVLLNFDRKPKKAGIEDTLTHLLRTLSLESSTTIITTEPFAKEEGSTWYRADGMLERSFKDKILSPHLRQAIAALRGTCSDIKLELVQDTSLFVKSRKPIRWMLWLRQSNEDGKRARDTMPRQLTTLLTSLILGENLMEGDEVLICCEFCSSSKHPLRDRRLWNTVRGMRDMTMQLLTVNPDRMTRRSAEVDEIRDFFVSTGGCWYTQGLIQEGRNITDWHIVEGDLIPLIKKQLDLGRQRALHGGYYGRRNKIMTRINDAVDRLDAIPTQIYAAAAMMGHFVETHGIQRVCLITRTGPTFQAGKQNTIDPSIIRQSCFLNTMFGACQFPDPNQVLRLELAGYSSGEVMGHLERLPQHARIDGVWVKNVKTLVVTTSIDRLVGSTAEYARFMQMCREKGHSGISMFWDHETEPDVLTALHLDNSHAQNPVVVAWEKALKGQKRAPSHNLNLPLLQPFVWALGHEQSVPAADHASRHVRNVETYRSAMKTSMYQGSDLIAHALSERSADSKGLSDERIKA